MGHKISQKLGTAIIAISCVSLIILLLPVIRTYIPNSVHRGDDISQPSISIPKINAYAPLIFDVDPWNASIYQSALKKGVAHAKGSAYPGEPGVTFLFAHSSGTFGIDLTQYNTVFFRLGELQPGDTIVINYDKRKYKYIVRRKEVVNAKDTVKLFANKNSDLILQTCTPPGTSFARLLVFAVLVS